MDEDLDELLEEVESKFLRQGDGKGRHLEKIPSLGDDGLPQLDEILRDMRDATPDPVRGNPDIGGGGGGAAVKCFPLCVSGAEVDCGLSTVASKRACSRLHCTSCDFGVQVFEGLRWRDDTDYLFLRTNMPHLYRLRERLRTAAGWRAYACQCRHYSTRQLVQLLSLPRLTWVCRGH